jgi:multiple sugar transport system permease protein
LVTVFYVIGTVPVAVALAFLVAFLLFQPIRLRDFIRTIYFLPYVTSTVAAGMVFMWIFNPQVGIINSATTALGLPAQTWLLDPDPVLKKVLLGIGWTSAARIPDWLAGPSVALCVVILFSIWSSLGFDVVIYLAGLANIPAELYEAARIDGAAGWQMLRHITIPLVSPTTFFLVVSIIRAFQALLHLSFQSGFRASGRT